MLPPATAQLVTARPLRSLTLAVVLALLTVWAALFIAYYSPYPIGFWLTTIAFGLYATTYAATAAHDRLGTRATAPLPAAA